MNTTDMTKHLSQSFATSSSHDPSPLEMDAETFYTLGHLAVEMATEYLATLPDKPLFRPMTSSQRHLLLQQPLPEDGRSAETLFTFFAQHILPYVIGSQHPRFTAWVSAAAAPIGILAEFLTAALNTNAAGGDHAAIYLEHCTVRWLMELLGFPVKGSAGLLVGGGSVASLTCLAAARHWAAARQGWNMRTEGLQGDHPRLLFYVSAEGHSCLRKASHLLGLGEPRIIPVDAQFKLELSALREAVYADRLAGRLPFCVVGSCGTVNTGSIDPLDALADFCHEEGLWLHVDGAYGAFGILDPSVASRYRGLAQADSVALDPHKWLATPLECSCALVRHGSLLRETFSLVPPYLQTEPEQGGEGLPWFSEYGLQLSRRSNALKLAWVIQQAGRSGLVAHVSRHLRLAQYMARLIDEAPDLQRMAPVELSIVCFRYAPPSLRDEKEQLDALNHMIMEQVQVAGNVFVNGTILQECFVLRSCLLHYALSEEDVCAILDEVCRVGMSAAEHQHISPLAHA